MSATPIDTAHAALEAAGDDAGLRMAFYGQVLAAELFLVLEAEPQDDRLRPLVLDAESGRLVLAFDRPERMAAFLDGPSDYIALAGRSLVAMLAGQGIGIALNPEVAPSANVIGPEAVDWLAGAAAAGTAEAERIRAFRPPTGVPAVLVSALEARLGAYAGRVREGFLAEAEYEDGSVGLVLALAGVPEEGEAAVAAAIAEAVRFSGAEDVRLDLLFPDEGRLARIARVAIVFRPEVPAEASPPRRRDPQAPPRLR